MGGRENEGNCAKALFFLGNWIYSMTIKFGNFAIFFVGNFAVIWEAPKLGLPADAGPPEQKINFSVTTLRYFAFLGVSGPLGLWPVTTPRRYGENKCNGTYGKGPCKPMPLKFRGGISPPKFRERPSKKHCKTRDFGYSTP